MASSALVNNALDAPTKGALPSPLLSSFRELHGRVALYGGSFDPIHHGHLAAARAAVQALNLDTVVFVPAAQNPLKTNHPLASNEQRLRMILAAVGGEHHMRVSPLEFERAGPSFTIDTVRQASESLPPDSELHLIIGGDCLASLHRWKEIDDIARKVAFIVIGRGEEGTGQSEITRLKSLYPGTSFHHVPLHDATSSTQLRDAIANGEQLPTGLPTIVGYIINEEGLYGRQDQRVHQGVCAAST